MNLEGPSGHARPCVRFTSRLHTSLHDLVASRCLCSRRSSQLRNDYSSRCWIRGVRIVCEFVRSKDFFLDGWSWMNSCVYFNRRDSVDSNDERSSWRRRFFMFKVTSMSFWSRRRFRITPLQAFAALFLMIMLFWYSLSRQETPQQPCSVPEEFTEKLHELTYRSIRLSSSYWL